jgi:hypothetical protein
VTSLAQDLALQPFSSSAISAIRTDDLRAFILRAFLILMFMFGRSIPQGFS